MLYKNKKNGKLYGTIGTALNATNAQDGQAMILYAPLEENTVPFVREHAEFFEKFEEVKKEDVPKQCHCYNPQLRFDMWMGQWYCIVCYRHYTQPEPQQ